MSKSTVNRAWVHITVAGGLVQRVFVDTPAMVFIEDFDSRGTRKQPSLAQWEAELFTSEELLRLLKKKAIPHRIVLEE